MAYIGASPADRPIQTSDIEDNAISVAKLASTLDLSSNTVTLPSGVGGKIVQAAYSVNTTEVTTSSGTNITSLSFTPTSASNKVILFANCGQYRKATGGTGSAAGLRIYIDSDITNAHSSNDGYPLGESDIRGSITCIGYNDCWSGAKTISLQGQGFGTGISYSYQSVPTTLLVLEVA